MQDTIFENDAVAMMTPRQTLLLGWGESHSFKQPPKNGKPAFYIPDFFLQTNNPWIQFEYIQEYAHLVELSLNSPLQITWQIPKKETFTATIKETLESIQKYSLKKAVPYLFGTAQATFSSVLRKHSLCRSWAYAQVFQGFTYAFWKKDEGIIGTTPEQLFQIKGKTLSTIACAGTVSALEQEKAVSIEQEHALVIKGIQQALSLISTVLVKPSLWKQAGPSLFHRVTPFEATLNAKTSFETLVALLHPTPAIGAYPKDLGDLWLKSYNQRFPRERYGAPIGYQWPEKEEAVVYAAIRNVQWNQNILKLGVGCGIVESSCFESEWKEWNAKFRSIRMALGI